MLFLYRVLINIILFVSPLIIIYRILINKEHPKRFCEKIGVFSKKRKKGKLIWFHGASVGEILSIIPLVEKLEKKNNIKQILITSNTLSSSKLMLKYKLKKTLHQFFPIDAKYLVNKFLNHWNPSLAVFIESEIWPHMMFGIKKRNIPLILINGRITKKTFKNWKKFSFLSKNIFKLFNLTLAQSKTSENFLKIVGANNVKRVGNLKFCEAKTQISKQFNKDIPSILKNKKILFCAVSTHNNEEIFCAKIHKELKEKFKDFVTIIIPRHIDRSDEIKKNIEQIGLNVCSHSSKKGLDKNTEIYLVDTYGETKKFLKISKIAFVGGSLVDHRGHNPFEAARLGCKIIHGPFVSNHLEAYQLLNHIKIANKINSLKQAKKIIIRNINTQKSTKKIGKKLSFIGNKILLNNQREIEKFIK